MPKIKVGFVQQQNVAEVDVNISKLVTNIRNCKSMGAQLVVLQELHNSLYFCQVEDVNNFDLAEPIPGKSTAIFGQLAKELGIVIVTSIFEKHAPGLCFNTSVVFDSNGAIAGKYRKMHIPDDPGFYEKFYFTPGDLGFVPAQTSLGKIGVLVCWDQWYPEAARLMAMAGAEILVYPTAIGWDPRDNDAEKQRQCDAWITVQRSHAIANGCFLISCNRTGYEQDPSGATKGIEFWGNSYIAGPQGEIIIKASHNKEENIVTEIDSNQIENVRRIWPFFRDRRIDAYNDITKRYL